MKRSIVIIVALLLCVSLVSCGDANDIPADDGTITSLQAPDTSAPDTSEPVSTISHELLKQSPATAFIKSVAGQPYHVGDGDIPTYTVTSFEDLCGVYYYMRYVRLSPTHCYDTSGNYDSYLSYGYDSEFFEENAIILTATSSASGTMRYMASYIIEKDKIVVELKEDPDHPPTTDDVGWHIILVPIPRAQMQDVNEIVARHER
ncbi:MAG: hypothetical protein IJY27_04555 [Clostridia bacterium]|nr:hypothetical protein [Clostridia bacterium]